MLHKAVNRTVSELAVMQLANFCHMHAGESGSLLNVSIT